MEHRNIFLDRTRTRDLKMLRRQRVYAAYARAASDPVFIEEMRSITLAFDLCAGDGLAPKEG